jgi:hypothetical protein
VSCFLCGTGWILKYCVSLLLALLLLALPSPLSNALTSLQSTFTSRTNGHCLGTFTTENFSLGSLTIFPPLFLLSLSKFRHGRRQEMDIQFSLANLTTRGQFRSCAVNDNLMLLKCKLENAFLKIRNISICRWACGLRNSNDVQTSKTAPATLSSIILCNGLKDLVFAFCQ